tara:strand:- start:28950 stop:30998 length:2049 start_codon:yes stop_codon:yes gene_type:complete
MGIGDFFKRAKKITQSQGEIIRILSGEQTSAGILVDQNNAFQITAVKAAVTRISEFIATLPLKLYRRVGERGKEEAKDHYLYDLMSKQPNRFMTSYTWRETAEIQTLLWGNHFSQIMRDRLGRIASITPLQAGATQVKVVDNVLTYHYEKKDGGLRIFPQDEIFHLAWFAYNGLQAPDPVVQARDAFGLSLGLEKFASNYLANEAAPSGVLEMKGALRNEEARQRLKDDWKKKQGKWGNKSSVAVLEQGMEFKPIANSPQESQLIEERKFMVTEIARFFNIPPHLIADLEHATFSNVEEQQREFINFCMLPWLVRWEQALDAQLLTNEEKKSLFFKFQVQALLRGDAESRANFYASGKQWGWLSSDNIRELEDMNPLPEGQGDVFLQPLNMVDASEAPTEFGINANRSISKEKQEKRNKKNAIQRSKYAEDFIELLEDGWSRVVNAEVQDIKKLINKNLSQRNTNQLMQEVEQYYLKDSSRIIPERTSAIYKSITSLISNSLIDDTGTRLTEFERDRFLKEYMDNLTGEYRLLAVNQLSDVIIKSQENNIPVKEALTERLDQWKERKAGKMARIQSYQAVNAIALESFNRSQMVKEIRWVNVGAKSCVFCKHLGRNGGKIIPVNDMFVEQGTDLVVDPNPNNAPVSPKSPFTSGLQRIHMYRKMKHPPLHRGCDCQIAPVVF